MHGFLKAILENPEALQSKRAEQILGMCGNGALTDESQCSAEFREFLTEVPSSILHKYASECLDSPSGRSPNSGLILQDLVNEVGNRLGFTVKHGYYRGSTSRIGNDGLWKSHEFDFVIEVKTSDLSVKLDNIARYRERLIESGDIALHRSSVLIVLGRQDTGDLEAQIRGSMHAYDIRMIGADAVLRLLDIKENLNDSDTFRRITELLKPIEYTRVDKLIDIVFSASEEAAATVTEALSPETVPGRRSPVANSLAAKTTEEAKSHTSPVRFYEDCVDRISVKLGKKFLKVGKVTYVSSDKSLHLVLLNSKTHPYAEGEEYFWYGLRANQIRFLNQKEESYVAFGCGGPDTILIIPYKRLQALLEGAPETRAEGGALLHKHVSIGHVGSEYTIKSGAGWVDIVQYKI